MWFDILGFVTATTLFGISSVGPKARPERAHTTALVLVGVIALAFVFFRIPAYPAVIPVSSAWLIGALVFLAVLSPTLGILEARRKPAVHVYAKSRFRAHVLMNLLGAAIASGLLVMARWPAGGLQVAERFDNDYALSIFLLLSVIIALTFIRSQQAQRCMHEINTASNIPPLPQGASDLAVLKWVAQRKDPLPEASDCFQEDSLVRWHQLGNLAHLTFAIYVVTTSLMYLLGGAMMAAREGDPLRTPILVVVILAMGLGFILACGSRGVNKGVRGIFLVFLTGTPAVLCAVVLWLALYASSDFRDITAFVLVTVGYVVYVVLLTVDLARRGERIDPYYYAALAIALVLATLLAGLYLAPAP